MGNSRAGSGGERRKEKSLDGSSSWLKGGGGREGVLPARVREAPLSGEREASPPVAKGGTSPLLGFRNRAFSQKKRGGK